MTNDNIFNEKNFKKILKIGASLALAKDAEQLPDQIVREAMEVLNADAGTLYMLSKDSSFLNYEIVKNNSICSNKLRKKLTPIPLYTKSGENHFNVAASVYHSNKSIVIDDVYQCKGYDFSGTKKLQGNNL